MESEASDYAAPSGARAVSYARVPEYPSNGRRGAAAEGAPPVGAPSTGDPAIAAGGVATCSWPRAACR
jgi:hypothetical protein